MAKLVDSLFELLSSNQFKCPEHKCENVVTITRATEYGDFGSVIGYDYALDSPCAEDHGLHDDSRNYWTILSAYAERKRLLKQAQMKKSKFDIQHLEAGESLDAVIASKVMRNKPSGLPYSTEIEYAWLIVEKLNLYVFQKDNLWYAGSANHFGRNNDLPMGWLDVSFKYLESGDTAPLAICRAALVANETPSNWR